MDEQRAIQHIKQGHIKGLEVLVLKYQEQAVRAAFLIMRDRTQAEDIVQAAFVKVFQRIDQYDINRPFGPWFLRIVTNDAVKSITRYREIAIDEHGEGDTQGYSADEDLLDGVFNVEQQLEQQELNDLIWKTLEQLSPQQRAVVVMRYYLNLDESSIAAQLNTPAGTIRWRLYAARQHLRFHLTPYFKLEL